MIETSSLRRKLLDLAITGKLVPRTGEWQYRRDGGGVCALREKLLPKVYTYGFLNPDVQLFADMERGE